MMNRKVLLFLCLSFCLLGSISMVFAQEEEELSVENQILKVNALAPGVEFEKKITDKTTLLFGAGWSLSFFAYSSFGESDSGVLAIPFISGEYRYYYNLKQRKQKGKSTLCNSGNFVASTLDWSFTKEKDLGSLGIVWGMQRAVKCKFTFTFEAGAVLYKFYDTSIYDTGHAILGVRIGYVLFK